LAPVPEALGARQRGIAAVALAAAVAVCTGHLGPGAGVVGIAVGGVGFILLGRIATTNGGGRQAALAAALPQACELLAVAAEAGLPLRAAVEAVAPTFEGPLGEALSAVAARTRLGMPEDRAWAELGSEPALETLARELARTASTGLGVARVLRDLAVDARRAEAAAALVRARRVGVRSVLPLMACYLPSFVLLGIVPVIGGIVANLFR
ncbi:MAG: type II secretion system F family protein, partial [Propionicimonas sp.]|nr:type II secretion system F family protein [Propionicimonas sp.]